MRILLIFVMLVGLAGCGAVGFPGVYRINVEQGNIVTQEMVDQLKPGMSRRQVRFILGTPLVEDSFNQDRWDYTYVTRNGQDIIAEQQLTVFFEGETLTHFTGTIEQTPEGEEDDGDTQSSSEESDEGEA